MYNLFPCLSFWQVVITLFLLNIKPGDKTSITVDVKDYKGNPLQGADVTLIAVDEAVLFLTGYKMGNPIDTFYISWDKALSTRSSRVCPISSYLQIRVNLFCYKSCVMGSAFTFQIFVKTLTGKTITLE